jgi:hypothetical protein
MYLAIVKFKKMNSTEILWDGFVKSFDTFEKANEFTFKLLIEHKGFKYGSISTEIIKQKELE